jgi:hypothetical protein
MEEWLQKLKIGDEVYIPDRFDEGDIKKVIRITPTQLIIEYPGYEKRFNKKTGKSVGTGLWDSTYLWQVTDKIRQGVKTGKLKRHAKLLLNNVRLPDKDTELQELINILSQYQKPKS